LRLETRAQTWNQSTGAASIHLSSLSGDGREADATPASMSATTAIPTTHLDEGMGLRDTQDAGTATLTAAAQRRMNKTTSAQ